MTGQKVPIFGMKRREFIRYVVAGAVARPLAARAAKVPTDTATVRPLHEWSYENGSDYYLLRYLHEAWDNESTGFTIECRAEKTGLTIAYDVFGDNYFKRYKRRHLKPKMELRSIEGRLSIIGELRENSLFPQFAFQLLQSSSFDVLKILSSPDAVMTFPNRSFKIWKIRKSSEISKFLLACAN